MKEVELKPIREKPEYYDLIEKFIRKIFRDKIYEPLIAELGKDKLKLSNSKSDLETAIRSGKIYFSNGRFQGKFSAQTTKELREIGAVWDRGTSTFKIGLNDLPMDIQVLVRASESRFNQTLLAMDKKLAAVNISLLADKLKMIELFDRSLFQMETDFKKSVKNIIVAPEMSEETREYIASDWADNMDKYIQKFTEEQIKELRTKILDNVMKGNRPEQVVKLIQKSYNVSLRKAKFLARQETSLMLASYKEARYTAAGSDEYIWKCVHMPKDTSPNEHVKGNVRFYHAQLNNTRQKWSEPPVTTKDGKRNHPGQDYNCRCYAVPIVKF